jgi:hypothetical protein
MISQIALAGLLTLSAVVLTAGPVRAHSGGLDAFGCHHDRKHGGYHCHQETLAGQSYVSQQEMLNALEALNQEPNDHPEWLQPPNPSNPPKKAPDTYTILHASI